MPFFTFWTLLGVLITVITLHDFYKTTLTARGGGPLSKTFTQAAWRLALKQLGPSSNGVALAGVGPALLLMLLVFWFGLSWLGWFFIFCGDEELIVNNTTGEYASAVERLYFAGYTLTTVGYGNYTPPTPLGQILSVIAGFNGLVLVTMAITYSIPVLSASVEKRQLALLIHALGENTQEIIDRGNDDGSFSYLADQLQSLNSQVASLSYKHLAYPMVHYFHDEHPSSALPLNLARLHEAITIILFAFPDLPKGKRNQFEAVQKGIETLIQHLKIVSPSSNEQIPNSPDCSIIKALEHSEKSIHDVQSFLETQANRTALLGYTRSDGWSWRDVHPKQPQ